MSTTKIVEVEVCGLDPPPPAEEGTTTRRPSWLQTFKETRPLDKFDFPPLGVSQAKLSR